MIPAPEKAAYTGRRGRKAMTAEQKSAKSRAAFAPAPMRVPCALPDPPDSLCSLGRAEWLRVGGYLEATDRVGELDRQALTAYCSSLSVYQQSMEGLLLGEQPLWGLSNMRPKRSVFADMASKHGAMVLQMARKFGMTARTRHLDHGRTGRPALPDEIHQLRGTTRDTRRARLANRSQFPVDHVSPPQWFSDCGAGPEWERQVGQLTSLGLWTPLDYGPMILCCASFALVLLCIARLRLDTEGLAIQLSDDLAVENPLLAIKTRHLDLCESIWEDYGMSPYDRTNFFRVDPDADDAAPLEIFPRNIIA